MKLIAIDPSFTRTGVAILDLVQNKFIFKRITPPGSNSNYKDMVERSAYIVTEVLTELKVYDHISIIMEEPMLTSLKASSLGILSGVVATTLLLLPNIKEIFTVNPSTLRSLNSAVPNRKNVNKKQLSKVIAGDILSFLETQGFSYEVIPTSFNKDGSPRIRQVSHDELEAFIFLILLMLDKNVLTYEQRVEIYKINKGFYTKNIKINKLK